MNYIIEPLTGDHDRSLFDCGEESLNVFLKQFARQNDARGLGRTYVAGLPDETRILGYYTLSSGSIAVEQMPEKLPRYPVPVAHLGRLAVDLEARRDGLGSHPKLVEIGGVPVGDVARQAVGGHQDARLGSLVARKAIESLCEAIGQRADELGLIVPGAGDGHA